MAVLPIVVLGDPDLGRPVLLADLYDLVELGCYFGLRPVEQRAPEIPFPAIPVGQDPHSGELLYTPYKVPGADQSRAAITFPIAPPVSRKAGRTERSEEPVGSSVADQVSNGGVPSAAS